MVNFIKFCSDISQNFSKKNKNHTLQKYNANLGKNWILFDEEIELVVR